MGGQPDTKPNKRVCVGLLAHVDAGKTTLSEAMLYTAGVTRSLGRVDHGDAVLDNFTQERQRGITIFSKQARLVFGGAQLTLLDTPGHVDFSAEMERSLDVLDCAVLVISGPAGVQSHTRTLWKLLRYRRIPTFLFINKMDLPGADRASLLKNLQRELGDGIFDYESPDFESLALCDERLLERFLETGSLTNDDLSGAIARSTVFPCWFGAALRLQGVEDFLSALADLSPERPAAETFSARVYKISRDEQGARLTHMRVNGGVLKVRDTLVIEGEEEKITQLRVYSGSRYTQVDAAYPGEVVAALGLHGTKPGMGLGDAEGGSAPSLEPVLSYQVLLPPGCDTAKAVAQFRQLEEEDPLLRLDWDERTQHLSVQLMGQIQLEILQELLQERFGLSVQFGSGSVRYRETIRSTVEGVGHFEPLRHYAEVHLLLEPGEPGSGLQFRSICSEDKLDRNWQRLILTHLAERIHLGVLTGSPITDMTITLSAGRAHDKHTEGGDFREATYRAVRQGLMQAESVLLEPWYSFTLELPQANVGRAITDLQHLGASFNAPETEGDYSILRGSAPVASMREYPRELASYTHGLGRLSLSVQGYAPCLDAEDVIEAIGYDPEADVGNTADSVFCSHGAGTTVKWRDVPRFMHLPSTLPSEQDEEAPLQARAAQYVARAASDKELMAIFERTYGKIRQDRFTAMRPRQKPTEASTPRKAKTRPDPGPEYLLVDGYNIIFAWDELTALAEDNLDAARVRLIERLRNFQGFRQQPVILVFDAYRVKGNPGSVEHFGGLSVVYTKEAETADTYIEKASYTLSQKHRVRVATSDAMEQLIILGTGALRISASAFIAEVQEIEEAIRNYLKQM